MKNKPSCPDCKTSEDMEEVDSNFIDPKGDGVGYEEPVYKCFKCGSEWEQSDCE